MLRLPMLRSATLNSAPIVRFVTLRRTCGMSAELTGAVCAFFRNVAGPERYNGIHFSKLLLTTLLQCGRSDKARIVNSAGEVEPNRF